MTGHPFAWPADEAGHVLDFRWIDDVRHAACSGCDWTAPAPGTGYARGRQLHSEAHPELTGATP